MRDALQRQIDYLRISITDRCNLRCAYCMPAVGVVERPHSEILRYEELNRLIDVALSLGFVHFRVTGGEPLARRGAADFVAGLATKLRDQDLSLTTNGTLLAPVAGSLRRAGLRRVNISLDTLVPAKYASITRRDVWHQAWDGVETALATGFDPVKLNVVVVRDFNDDEVLDFAHLTVDRPLHVRFIELMPLGEGCAVPGGHMPADDILAALAEAGPLAPLTGDSGPPGAGPAISFRWRQGQGSIGVITAMSHKFCDRCNRLRLTADGRLEPCLGAEESFDLRQPLRSGAGDETLRDIFRQAAAAKPACHHLEESTGVAVRRRMSRIGG